MMKSLISSVFLVIHTNAASSSLSWHYEEGLDGVGPTDWASISGAELCGHSQQSPIEIDPSNLASAVSASCSSPLAWSVPNATFNFSVSHKGESGHTILFQNDQLSDSVSLMNAFQTDSAQHTEYLLDSLHFHWGPDDTAGSEHVFTGRTTTLEVHFVHFSSDYASVGDAVAAWDTLSADDSQDMHSLAVIGVLFEEVADNEDYDESADAVLLSIAQDPQMDDVWRNATGYAYLEFAIGDLIDVEDVIENYYVYDGSLTTPPCTPAVKWHLARNPLAVRKSTMDLFRIETKLWEDATGQIDADSNFRPTQSNPSCIWVCADDDSLKWCPAEEEDIDYGEQWHYEDTLSNGPSTWADFSALCGHEQQSPILIDPLAFDDADSCAAPLEWTVPDTAYEWTITHKGEHGHTLNVYSGESQNDVVLDNVMSENGQHEQFKLYSFHFHWGPGNQNGSEHVFEGTTTTFEVHFVHYSTDYASLGDAVGAWDALSEDDAQDMHTLGVVGVLFEEVGDAEEYNVDADAVLRDFALTPEMDALWYNVSDKAHLTFAISDLIDVEDVKEHYYLYQGSLTTPPCTPAVRWHLAQNTVKVRGSTMDYFRAKAQIWSSAHHNADSNFRPVQSNPNCVYTCADNAWCPGLEYPEWHYEEDLDDGPSNWGSINALCDHEQQSPILIDPEWFADEATCETPLDWHVEDTQYDWTVTHKGESGHTLSVYSADAKADTYLYNAFGTNGDQHEKYKFYSLHFHWGKGNQNGSEHVFEGTTSTFEVHFVHYSSDYEALGDAVGAWDALSADDSQDMHTLGVVGFLFEEVGDAEEYNTAADAVLLQFAQDASMSDVWAHGNGSALLTFAITDLVDVADFEAENYHYWGSLTTPPCTPAVSWHLARNTIKVRGSTMDTFRARTTEWTTSSGYVNADQNFRPVQTNPSCVSACGEDYCPADADIEYPEWHYEENLDDGPSNWGSINALCDHEQQSPILIDPSKFDAVDTCSEPLDWHVEETQYDWTVTHKGESGHTLSVYSADAKADTYLYNAFGTNGDQHEKYKLYGFHFHWGPGNQNGSEHVFEGATTTFEVHFVHYSSDYASVGDAVGAWDALAEDDSQDMHTLGVVGFLFEEVGDDEAYNEKADFVLLEFAESSDMESVWSTAEGEATLSFAITDLVEPESFESSYFHYWGSLTTPPCTPAVSWHLARNTIKVRGSTMDTFREKTVQWTTASGAVDADRNFRPLQSNPSCIESCGEEYCPADEGIEFPEWHYEEDLGDGPSNWGSINALCDHEQQSPISIDPAIMDDFFACQTPLDWHVADTTYDWTVTHKGESGHTLSVYSADAKADTYLYNAFGTNGDQHEKYKFYSLHFHWGPGDKNGSEHVYDGVTSTFEVHFVHYSGDYLSLGDAVGAWDALSEDDAQDMHTLGVVGFLFEEVSGNDRYDREADAVLRDFATNDDMSEVWAHGNGSAQISFAIGDLVDVAAFESKYYHYWGSLTTPPCTPAVSWHLAQNTMKVRRSTMELFREKTKEWTTSNGRVNADRNFRPVQTNPSCVSKCSVGDDMEWCPVESEDEESVFSEEEENALWIILGVVLGLVLLGVLVFLAKNSQARKRRNALARQHKGTQEMTSMGKRERLRTHSHAGGDVPNEV